MNLTWALTHLQFSICLFFFSSFSFFFFPLALFFLLLFAPGFNFQSPVCTQNWYDLYQLQVKVICNFCIFKSAASIALVSFTEHNLYQGKLSPVGWGWSLGERPSRKNPMLYSLGRLRLAQWLSLITPTSTIIIISKFLAQDNDFPAFWLVP